MNIEHTIIFAGSANAGKTTAISSVSDIPVVSTDESTPDIVLDLDLELDLEPGKATAVMDYGMMNLGGHERIHLFATPEEERFDFMWDALTKDAIGLVLLVDNSRKDPFMDLKFFLGAFENYVAEGRVVIGVTRMDDNPFPALDAYHELVESLGARLPIFELDARRRADVQTALRALLYSQDPGLVGTPHES